MRKLSSRSSFVSPSYPAVVSARPDDIRQRATRSIHCERGNKTRPLLHPCLCATRDIFFFPRNLSSGTALRDTFVVAILNCNGIDSTRKNSGDAANSNITTSLCPISSIDDKSHSQISRFKGQLASKLRLALIHVGLSPIAKRASRLIAIFDG